MRKSTLLWLTLAAFSGAALFHTSQKVHDGRQRLESLNESIAREEESMRVLTAEWGYLNQPARLEKLAKSYLKLAPLKGHQFAKIDDIPQRPAPTPEAVAAADVPVAEAPAETITEAAAKPAEKTAAKIAEKPPEKTAEKVAEKAIEKPAVKPAPLKAATVVPPIKIVKPTAPAAAPKPAAPSATAAGTTRDFSDLMKRLGHD